MEVKRWFVLGEFNEIVTFSHIKARAKDDALHIISWRHADGSIFSFEEMQQYAKWKIVKGKITFEEPTDGTQ